MTPIDRVGWFDHLARLANNNPDFSDDLYPVTILLPQANDRCSGAFNIAKIVRSWGNSAKRKDINP